MSADPSASIWEVTRMILDSPDASPSMIAHAHGFSAVEVADLLPIFLDNLRADFSSADGPAPALVPPAPQPGETPEEHADRYLSELARSEHLDVVGYDTLGATDGDFDPDLDSDPGIGPDLDADPTFGDATAGNLPHGDVVAFDDADDGARADLHEHDLHEHDLHDHDLHADPMHDLAADDPFEATTHADTDAPRADDTFAHGAPEHDVLADHAPAGGDDPGEPFGMG